MASDYTDSFAGEPYFIHKGEQLSAAGMTKALNTKEKVANKVTVINDGSTDAQYPSAKAVYASLDGTSNNLVHKTGNETMTGVKTFGTTSVAAEPLLGKAKTTDAANDGTKFASEAQVYKKQDSLTAEQLSLLASLNTLGFFPKGTILPISAAAWDGTSYEFRIIWKICNAANHTANPTIPNLTNKFLRGADYPAGETGDGKKRLSREEMPSHQHDGTTNSNTHSHTVNSTRDFVDTTTSAGGYITTHSGYDQGQTITFGGGSHDHSFATSYVGGGQEFDVIPAFYTVIYIMKVA
jgi:hypothetical protein